MTSRRVGILLVVVAVGVVAPPPASAQGQGSSWTVPRTADGQPDLQGLWANNSATPLERPEQLAGKAVLSDEELAELTQRVSEFRESEQAGDLLGDRLIQQALGNPEFNDFDVITGNYNAFWLVERHLDNRTSLIVDPPNGRIPALTAEADARASAREAYGRAHPSDGPEDRNLGDRCLHFAAPRLSAGYNSYFQILQTPNHVAILQEMGHISRVIPLDGRPHVDGDIQLWTGDSRGHWEGDTLVVETTNYSAETRYNGASEGLRLVERFTRVGPDTVQHEVTLNDPATWTEPWTVLLVLKSTQDPIFEYACHEGNYAMPGILGGARLEETMTQTR